MTLSYARVKEWKLKPDGTNSDSGKISSHLFEVRLKRWISLVSVFVSELIPPIIIMQFVSSSYTDAEEYNNGGGGPCGGIVEILNDWVRNRSCIISNNCDNIIIWCKY